jgi:diguanylate cyclase (GGDEF)-like protein
MHRSLLAVLVSATLLLVVAIGGGMTSRANALASERTSLAERSAVESQLLDDYFKRASGLLNVTARNPVFVDYYGLPGTQADRARSTGVTMERVVDALAYLGRMYPDRTGTASFVDDSGAENARVVSDQASPANTLSTDVTAAPFFKPTLELPSGVVYQSKPYLSREINQWVISSSTQVFTPDRVRRAMVRFEVPIESFRRQSSTVGYGQLLIVDASTGSVVIDAAHETPPGQSTIDSPDKRFVAVRTWGENGTLTIGGRQAVYHRVPADVGNANHWYAVVVASRVVTPVTGVGWLPAAIALVSMLVIGCAIPIMRRAQSALMSAANADPLTGLCNRRRLVADLNHMVSRASPERPVLLMLSDLNGFKAYNDTFGHPEGDELLIRLAGSLTTAVGERGIPYRIGGDEFCVLAQLDRAEIDGMIEIVAAALKDNERAVTITASHGAVVLPDETTDPTEAIHLVDVRMYGNKRHRRATDPPSTKPRDPRTPVTRN